MLDPRQVVADLAYQVFRPDVTTIAECHNTGCHESSRGGNHCVNCLVSSLNQLSGGGDHGLRILASMEAERAQRVATEAVKQAFFAKASFIKNTTKKS